MVPTSSHAQPAEPTMPSRDYLLLQTDFAINVDCEILLRPGTSRSCAPPPAAPTTATMTDCWPLPMPESEPAGWGCDTRGLRSTFLWLTRLT